MTDWILWGLLLVAQNASNTWVSRARNSASYAYHGLASVFSNGVWFFCFFIAVDLFPEMDSPLKIAGTALFYVACTVTGSVIMHWVAKRYLESGKRHVGAR